VYIREDMADIRVSLDGVDPFGIPWKTAEGGALEAADSKTRPGAMGREVSLGGAASRGDLTCTVQFSDVIALSHIAFERKVGVGRVKVAVNWLGTNRALLGSGFTRVGTLKSATVPDTDSESSDPGMYTIVVSCDELGV
jgi:hypothetical protein